MFSLRCLHSHSAPVSVRECLQRWSSVREVFTWGKGGRGEREEKVGRVRERKGGREGWGEEGRE